LVLSVFVIDRFFTFLRLGGEFLKLSRGCAHSFRADTLSFSPFISFLRNNEQQCPKFSVQS
jgi:hypothetical protein